MDLGHVHVINDCSGMRRIYDASGLSIRIIRQGCNVLDTLELDVARPNPGGDANTTIAAPLGGRLDSHSAPTEAVPRSHTANLSRKAVLLLKD